MQLEMYYMPLIDFERVCVYICDPPARNESETRTRVALLLVHFLGTATFPKGVPYIDFGFSTKSVFSVFSTIEKYTCYTRKKFISVISKCLKQATLQ